MRQANQPRNVSAECIMLTKQTPSTRHGTLCSTNLQSHRLCLQHPHSFPLNAGAFSNYDLEECSLCYTRTSLSRYHGLEVLRRKIRANLNVSESYPLLELIAWSCKTRCINFRCKCRKNGLHCTTVWGCNKQLIFDQSPCYNRPT